MREEKSKSTNEMKSMLSSIFQSVLASSSNNLVVASSYKVCSVLRADVLRSSEEIINRRS
ncbi:BnaC02g34210D [Brassica napus]|uniref:BnaC02g34210D protein n=2 Tax=Brassica TaxID=3705 RepID=A0A078FSH5_BRANA|nr:BnaC02g34210D [Brassica napus]VDD25763.1 unnamed protein product [Brassica oleracea]